MQKRARSWYFMCYVVDCERFYYVRKQNTVNLNMKYYYIRGGKRFRHLERDLRRYDIVESDSGESSTEQKGTVFIK